MTERLNSGDDLRKKLDGDVVWQRGDTPASFAEKEDQYYRQRVAAVRAGEATWVRRNFDADRGACYDLYNDGIMVGSVVVDEHDCDVYGTDGVRGIPFPLDSRPGIQLEEAVGIVEAQRL